MRDSVEPGSAPSQIKQVSPARQRLVPPGTNLATLRNSDSAPASVRFRLTTRPCVRRRPAPGRSRSCRQRNSAMPDSKDRSRSRSPPDAMYSTRAARYFLIASRCRLRRMNQESRKGRTQIAFSCFPHSLSLRRPRSADCPRSPMQTAFFISRNSVCLLAIFVVNARYSWQHRPNPL